MNVDNKMEFRNILRSLKSIDFLVLFLFLWMLVSHYNNVNYTNWYGILSDISLRNNLLIFFYYSISRLFFHYYRITSFYICIAIMLFVAFKESYLSIWQLIEGADVPVGSMINPVIEGCIFSITCCVSFVAIQKIPKKKIRVILLFLLSPFIILILLTKSRLALIELIIPILCYFSLNNKYSVLVKKHAVLIIVSLVTLFSVLYVVKKPSADGRFYMAKIAVLSISHNGVFGSGTESYSGRFGEEQYKYFGGNEGEVDINTIVNNDLRGSMYACSPATAFNEFLRLGVEYGVIAMLLSVIITIILNSSLSQAVRPPKQIVCTCASCRQRQAQPFRVLGRNAPAQPSGSARRPSPGTASASLLGSGACTPGGTAASGTRPGFLLGCGPSRPASRHPVRVIFSGIVAQSQDNSFICISKTLLSLHKQLWHQINHQT
jgi:hypothetical protein